MTPVRIANRDARPYVESLTPFKGHNLYAVVNDHGDYVVFSYGSHHPLLVAVPQQNGQALWFANKYKRSVTTAKHLNQSLPQGVDVIWLSLGHMEELVYEGYNAFLRKHLSI